jgi:peptidoglycan hydrolase-like protein with peptidoglycan-binding domain
VLEVVDDHPPRTDDRHMAGEPTLRLGDTGEWVTYLQQCLNAFDMYSPIEETGTYDESTEGKVRFVQGTVGVSESGVMDEQTWAAFLAFMQTREGGADGGTGTGGTGEGTGGDYDKELPLDVTVDLKPNGTVAVTAGNPSQRIAAKSQGFSAWSVFADGSEHSGWFELFPSEAMDPGASETLEFDYAYATVEHGDQTGAKLYVYQTYIGKTVVPYDIVDGECRPTGEVSFEAESG